MKILGFGAAFRRRGLWKQDLEDAPGDANDAVIVAHPDSELDGVSFGVPSGVRWEAEEHGSFGCSANVLRNIPQARPGVEGLVLSVRSYRDLHIAVVNQLPPPSLSPGDNDAVLPASAIDRSMIFGDPLVRKNRSQEENCGVQEHLGPD